MKNKKYAFTFIEISIVLVIIGLIVGGILVGRDLISASQVRSQISQLEEYRSAANTFKLKYNALPGDIAANQVAQIGFSVVPTRTGVAGLGDGNGLIKGYGFTTSVENFASVSGEAAWFWVDLTANTGLIKGNFNYAGNAAYSANVTNIDLILPQARIGGRNYIMLHSYNFANNSYDANYFSTTNLEVTSVNGYPYNNGRDPGISVNQAYQLDSKLDDGLPQSGRVVARYVNVSLSASQGGSLLYGRQAVLALVRIPVQVYMDVQLTRLLALQRHVMIMET